MLNRIHMSLAVLTLLFAASAAVSQSTQFTYQGNLKSGGANANGSYDFQFALFDASSGGNQIGGGIAQSSVAVTDGVFSVNLDFGSVFPGASRFLEISVRSAGSG